MAWIKAFLRSVLLSGVLALSLYLGTMLALLVGLIPLMMWMIIILPFLPVVVMAFIYRISSRIASIFAANNSSRSLWPTFADWKEGIRAEIVLVTATLLAVLSAGAVLTLMGSSIYGYGRVAGWSVDDFGAAGHNFGYFIGRSAREGQLLVNHLSSVWLISATCLYRYDDWARARKRRRQAEKKRQPEYRPTQKFTPPDPIELELEKMRSQIGTTKVKRHKKRPPHS